MAETVLGVEVPPTTQSRRPRFVRLLALVGAVSVVAGALAIWNPWRLVALDGPQGFVVLTSGVLVVGIGGSRLAGRQHRVSWWLSALVGAVGGLLLVLISLLLVAVEVANPFAGDVLEEQTVGVGDGVTVVRRTWSAGALRSCVDFEVRVGHGLLARHGERTSCVDSLLGSDWEISVVAGELIIERSDGGRCLYSIDRSVLRLVADDAVACESLVVD